jgi:uncharacterized protein DUF6788
MSLDEPARNEIRQITNELTKLARTGKILPGSIQQRHTRCGRSGCACQDDPPRPHGPYWQWTRKVAGKTITRRLTTDQIERYRPWIENDRRIRELLTRLEQIGITHLEAAHHRD